MNFLPPAPSRDFSEKLLPAVVLNQKSPQTHTAGKLSFLGAFEMQSTEQFPEAFPSCEVAYGGRWKRAQAASTWAGTPVPTVGGRRWCPSGTYDDDDDGGPW